MKEYNGIVFDCYVEDEDKNQNGGNENEKIVRV